MKCTKRLAHLIVLLAFAFSLSGCGTAGALKNMGTGLAQTVMHLPRGLWNTARRTGSGVGQSLWRDARSVMNMGPRVLSVPAQ